MRRRLLALLFVAMTAITILAPAGAGASDGATVVVEKSRNAIAYYQVIDGCLETYILVFAAEDTGMSNDESPDRHDVGVLFFADAYDACQDEMVFSVETYATDLNVDISAGLNRATITGTTTARDFRNDVDVPLTLDLRFEAFGPAYHDHDMERERDMPGPNGGTLTVHLHAQARWHSAVSGGTIAIGEHVVEVSSGPDGYGSEIFGFNAGQVVLEQ
jgi:hypothetical protein